MEDLTESDYRRALRVAERLLRRFDDVTTSNVREDLAQEAVLAMWRGRGRLREPGGLDAYLRSTVRRMRGHALCDVRRVRRRPLEEVVAPAEREPGCGGALRVAGRLVDCAWMLAQLDRALDALGAANAAMVRDFYGGEPCAEIAARHGLTTAAVRARIHRGRRRLRSALEARVRDADLRRAALDPRPRPVDP